MSKTAKATLNLTRETKNTGRYDEPLADPDNDVAVIGTVYVPKATLEAITGSKTLPVKVEVTVAA